MDIVFNKRDICLLDRDGWPCGFELSIVKTNDENRMHFSLVSSGNMFYSPVSRFDLCDSAHLMYGDATDIRWTFRDMLIWLSKDDGKNIIVPPIGEYSRKEILEIVRMLLQEVTN